MVSLLSHRCHHARVTTPGNDNRNTVMNTVYWVVNLKESPAKAIVFHKGENIIDNTT